MSESAIRLEGVSKSYGSVTALFPTDLTIRSGEFFTLLGPSGSGKTTILNVIAGMTAASGGRILIGERDVTRVPAGERGLGMVFQNYALMPHMSVFENVAFPLRVRRLKEDEIQRQVGEALEIVRLPNMSERKPKQLSGGQQQRVALARSLVYRPSIILMDEPLSALDKKLRDSMQFEIRQIHASLGVTVVYVTHDQGEALAMSNRICLMNGGRIEQLGTPHELYFNPKSVFAADFLGESNILDVTVGQGAAGGARLHIRCAGTSVDVGPCRLAPGTSGKIMIRPESLTLSALDGVAHGEISGTVDTVTMIGGVTELRLALPDGSRIALRELTSRKASSLDPGRPVTARFKPDDVVILA
ncbi:ABC transporter ATP-binding protein [Bosea sp. (in: a-proteobacteria)]|uniref:ABC transporter ATP-binding protein n=1 Tax=Bosea sp. (in: a-proteobacteria) TaxID=1871050 RepID=UPI00260B7656|nr:ABC transporter ATP-binding protein [Bosea sp. (in: a-proteobacteria)]MCO5089486.1 ABC transporter ATP-binding protein [Bosea sp. (in: a-proteobacteria)]